MQRAADWLTDCPALRTELFKQYMYCTVPLPPPFGSDWLFVINVKWFTVPNQDGYIFNISEPHSYEIDPALLHAMRMAACAMARAANIKQPVRPTLVRGVSGMAATAPDEPRLSTTRARRIAMWNLIAGQHFVNYITRLSTP